MNIYFQRIIFIPVENIFVVIMGNNYYNIWNFDDENQRSTFKYPVYVDIYKV